MPTGPTRGLRCLVGLAACVCVITAPTLGLPNQALQPVQDESGLSARQQNLLALVESNLLSPSKDITESMRRAAAEELLAMRVPEAIECLDRAIASGHAPSVRAAAQAIVALNQPEPALMEPIISALTVATPDTLDALARAASAYDSRGLRAVRDAAFDAESDVSARLGPIHALGAFRNRDAAQALIDLLSPAREEPKPVTDAACASLENLSGFPHGDNPARWRTWWAWARDLPPEEWLRSILQRLNQQNADLQHRLSEQQRLIDESDQRVFSVYNSLFPKLDPEQQITLLPSMLQDPLPSVRNYAVSRVDVLVRASHVLPAEIRDKLAALLDDPNPSIRRQSAILLDQLDHAGLGDALAARLGQETEPAVIQAWLEVLTRRPAPGALDAARAALTDPELTLPAANALWAIVSVHELDATQLASVAVPVASVVAASPTPAHARLLAATGVEDDFADLETLLEEGDDAMRRAIAEGFYLRRLSQRLLEHADDPAVYPFTVRIVADGEPTIEKLRSLLMLQPPAGREADWDAAATRLCSSIAPERLLEADSLLAASTFATRATRIAILENAVTSDENDLEASVRLDLTARLADLRLEAREYDHAHRLLESINGEDVSPAILALRFEAAALARQYDRAFEFNPDPSQWVALLERMIDEQPAVARALQIEIARRFADTLADEPLARFNDATSRLDAVQTTESTAAGDSPS